MRGLEEEDVKEIEAGKEVLEEEVEMSDDENEGIILHL